MAGMKNQPHFYGSKRLVWDMREITEDETEELFYPRQFDVI